MARHKGYLGAIEAGASPVGEIVSFEIEISADTADGTRMGHQWKSMEAMQKSAKGKIEVLRDPADAGQILLAVGATVTLTLFTEGETTGLTSITGPFIIESMGISTKVDDLVKTSYSVINQADITIGTVA